MLAKVRASKHEKDPSRPLLRASVYDNGVPIIEDPWERLRSQPLDVWNSNGTLNGTLSWYSIVSYGLSRLPSNGVNVTINDPWTSPYPVPYSYPNGSLYLKEPAGWGYLLYPPLPSKRIVSQLPLARASQPVQPNHHAVVLLLALTLLGCYGVAFDRRVSPRSLFSLLITTAGRGVVTGGVSALGDDGRRFARLRVSLRWVQS
jgi:hypothetical protein